MISQDTSKRLQSKLNDATSDPSTGIPGLVYAAVDAQGEIFNHAAGSLGLGIDRPMQLDSTFYLASCTKLMTGIACLQLVEQGRIAIDDADAVERLAPELVKVEVLTRKKDGTLYLVPKQRRISLRMLLNHTAGFGYAFEDAKYGEWARPGGIDDFSGFSKDVLHRPLVNQPGTKFQYGTSVDWAGVLVERLTGLSLEEYFRQNIWEPLEIRHISFFPDRAAQERLAYMHQRAPDRSLKLRDHIYRYPLTITEDSQTSRYCMGGAGCFGRPIEICKIISMLLNDGVNPGNGKRLLKRETVTEMFTDQIPDLPRSCNEYTPSVKPELANPCPLTPAPDGLTEGWGLTFSLSHQRSPSGRAAGSASWEGLPNLFWFADRVNGIGGIIASQILPYGDLKVLSVAEDVETIIYHEIAAQRTDTSV